MIFLQSRCCLLAVLLVIPGLVIAGSTDFRQEGDNLFGTQKEWAATAGAVKAAEGVVTLRATGDAPATFKTGFSADPGAEYFFSANTLSDHRVVFALAGLNMSYHTQGQAQTVCGLVRSDQNGKLDLTVSLRSLKPGGPVSAELKNLTLQKVMRPKSVDSRPRDGKTVLVENGQAQASIIYPSGSAAMKALAGNIQATIEKISGVSLPMIPDADATTGKYPKLKPEFEKQNLILLGQIGNNRAIMPAYNRFLTAEDGYYPGGDGYVVRTASNVISNGRNHLILGGSSEAGVKKAAEKFQELISKLPASGEKKVSLPWLLDVELGGECLAAFDEDEKVWQDPANPQLAAMTSGYGKVIRWYQNAMGYYWSGRESYLERSREYLKQILSERAYTHHYIAEFFVRTYDMLDDSPVFTREQIVQLDSLVLENFLDFLTKDDLRWMTIFSPPYRDISIVNRHQVSPWYADIVMARFLGRNAELGGELKELAAFRESEKDKAFRSFVSNRNGPSMPGMAAAADFEEIPASFFRFALENDLYEEFVASGLAHQTLALDRFDHNGGRYAWPACAADLLPGWLGAMAHLTGDGRYTWLARNVPFAGQERGPFQGRYVAKVHRYQIGGDFPAIKPGADWAGIQIAPQPHKEDQTPEITPSKFPLLTIRNGYEPGDDYLAVVGLNSHIPSGTLAVCQINGMSVLGFNESDSSRVTTNGASAIRLSGYKLNQLGGEDSSSPCKVKWTGMFPGLWSVEVETLLSPDMQWSRIITRLENGVYAFCDTFTAKQQGKYLLRVGWQPSTTIATSGQNWQVVTNKGKVIISKSGSGFTAKQRGNSLAWESTRSMKEGEQATVWTVVQGMKHSAPAWESTQQGENQIELSRGTERQTILRRGPLETSDGPVRAALVTADNAGIGIFGLQMKGQVGLQSAYLPRDGAAPGSQPLPISIAAIDAALGKNNESAEPQSQVTDSSLSDETAKWAVTWSYDGFLKPTLLQKTDLSEDLLDFGKAVNLTEVRSLGRARTWETTQVSREIYVAPPDAKAAPAPDSAEWIRLEGKYELRPGVRTGNYGEAHPEDHADESLFLKNVKTRFVRAPKAGKFLYYASEELTARHPVELTMLRDIPGISFPLLQAKTDNFPAFPRPMREDDFSLALLNAKTGSPLTQIEVKGPVQATLVADQKGKGLAEIFVLKGDVKIETFSLDGKPGNPIDLQGQFAGFQKAYGRENTRHPAGGHYMPFSFGLWRKNSDGASKFVIGRYGSLAFLDENRKLEGILSFPSYASPGMLPRGYDFDGNGSEEMLMLERSNLVQIGGEPKPEVRNAAIQFWPQVYTLLATTMPKGVGGSDNLTGDIIRLFEPLEQFGGKLRYVLVVRGNYLGLYDAIAKKWELSWSPPAPISAAGLVKQTAEKIQVALATVDGILWNLTWDYRILNRPIITLEPTSLTVKEIRPGGENDGSALIAASEGLFFQSPSGPLSLMAKGSFQSALMPSPDQVVSADATGKILNFQRSPK